MYLDDFAVYGDRSAHFLYLKSAFEHLSMNKSSLSPEKCKFGFCEGILLGHIISKDGIKVDPEKVKRILELREPRNAKEVSTLWGMANYHNRFIPNLAARAKPIISLIHKNTLFSWSSECDMALKYIREKRIQDPVLRKPDWEKTFFINPSSIEIAVAAVLMQNDASGRAHPIYYASRLLTSCEFKYPSSEKLAVALLFACVKFKHYFSASLLPIVVQYEQEGLKQVIQQTKPSSRAAKFVAVIQQFDLTFKKIQGQRVLHVKALLDLEDPPASNEGELSDEAGCYVIFGTRGGANDNYRDIMQYLMNLTFPPNSTAQQRKDIR
jgi:hypothetical protein